MMILQFHDFLREAEEKPLPKDRELKSDKHYVLMQAQNHNLFEVAKFRKWLNDEQIPYEKFVDNTYSGFELQVDDPEILSKIKAKLESEQAFQNLVFK